MPHVWRRFLFALGVAVVLGLAAWGVLWFRQGAAPVSEPRLAEKASPPGRIEELPLPAGIGPERELSEGAVHVYRVDLAAGELLHLFIDQIGADAVVRLVGPDGHLRYEVDSASSRPAPEEIFFVAESAGGHRIELLAYPRYGGKYRLRLEARRPASEPDRRRAAALEAFHLARVLGREGRDEEAAAGFLRAIELGDGGLQAEARRRLGNLYADSRRFDLAVETLDRALAYFQETGDLRNEALVHNDLGDIFKNLGEVGKAERHFRRALDLAPQVGDLGIEATALTDLGLLASDRGERWEALSSLGQALPLWQSLGDPQHEAVALIGTGTAYRYLGETVLALDSFQQALERLQRPEDREGRSIALTQRGTLFAEKGRFEEARGSLDEALRLRQEIGDRNGEAGLWIGIGYLRYLKGEYREALPVYQKALAIYEETRDPRGRIAAWINLAWAHAALDDFGTAAGFFDRALPLARATKNRPAAAAALYGLAWIERKRGNLAASRRWIEESLVVVEGMRDAAERRELKANYLASQQGIYGLLIDLLMELHERQPAAGHDAEALAVSERARGRSLFDDIAGSGGRLARPFSIPEIQRSALGEEALLLEYRLGEERSYLWAVDRESVASFELPPKEEIERLAKRLRDQLLDNRRGRNERAIQREAKALGRILLGPVAGLLGDRPLWIAADGNLHGIPFALLPDPAPDPRDAAARPGVPPPLILRHEISYSVSASVLAAQHRRRETRRPASYSLAALGDPVSRADDERLRGVLVPPGAPSVFDRSGGWGRLYDSSREIEAIASLLPRSSVFTATGFEATRSLVTSGRLKGAGILHFAVHGRADPEDGGKSALVLSLFDEGGRRLDGLVRAEELYGLGFSADLVVLSACETGLGEDVRGEGLVGLPQSFLASGASNVVVSLWRVKDYSTAELMQRFYRALLHEGRSPAAALRQAQVSMWREKKWSRPYDWAGFVVQGTGMETPLRPPRRPASPS